MSNTQTLTPDALLEAAEKLSYPDLDKFADRVARLRVQRRHPNLPQRETELLQKINDGLPEEVWHRYHALVMERKNGALSAKDHEVLKELTNQIEIAHARRIGYLVELAQLRGKTLDDMMDELGIKPPGYE